MDPPTPWAAALNDHAIERLMRESESHFQQRLARRSDTLEDAAARYRERRGRHPPPGFDVWFAQAKADDAIVVEEFFDRIHHDINPFWAFDPKELRARTSNQLQVIRVREGKVSFETDNPNRPPYIQTWTALLNETGHHLPDLDIVVNVLDESRILVPWEKINGYVAEEQRKRKLVDPKDAITRYSGLDEAKHDYDPGWITDDANKYWDYLRATCSPDSPARNTVSLASFEVAVEYPNETMPYTLEGFVRNATDARDPCLQPHLRGMHGTFVESVSMSTTRELIPMFAGCKLPQNNEILVPGAAYLSGDDFYSGGEQHGPKWRRKKAGLVWRGTASGGRNQEGNWWHFHRHRWVQMMNGSTVSAVERGDGARGPTFGLWDIPANLKGRLGKWVASFADVAFVNLECFPSVQDEVGSGDNRHTETRRTCAYTSPYMAIKDSTPMKEQYTYKYLPDVDGNSFSGRWRAFLLSTSLPLKATIYAEWHDDRFAPWVHYVPFDNSFADIYAVMDYFLAHDRAAEAIATEGKRWAERVYRREDMKLYVWRLLLEYARVVDDKRDRLAFVGDLKSRAD
ncbi:Lipopolysaccharide-modifying protein [Purpureocillium lavendulum]|uniref:Lipopolysaccharide-modifying protein n=1 Tax=Purpureocillium lavendulum TaxID=1247861 RepID=A0AB34FE24_9HYPO|nr:Lipopolysaccharide-modifying protein [Purpureocillium lavendulum]